MANKRHIFIIKPAYQYKLSLIICSLVLLGSAIYPKTIYDLFEKIIAMQPEKAAEYMDSRLELMLMLIILQVIFIGIVFIACIFISHKTAGPIYKLQNYLQGVRDGEIDYPLSFRDGDNFHELAADINETIESFKTRKLEELEYLEEVITYIDNIALVLPSDKKPILKQIKGRLQLIIDASLVSDDNIEEVDL